MSTAAIRNSFFPNQPMLTLSGSADCSMEGEVHLKRGKLLPTMIYAVLISLLYPISGIQIDIGMIFLFFSYGSSQITEG